MTHNAILLMGPTASGKTGLAVSLCKRFPCDIISVDSALVYRGMDIGTAKPGPAVLARAPHQLIDIREPEESYSAGEFVRDARAATEASFANGRIPLLVGGTMMYFRALTKGLAELPSADASVRSAIDARADKKGWPAMHAALAAVDPRAANRINANDSQRIQRALEVFEISGVSLSEWQEQAESNKGDVNFIKIALTIEPRSLLHERIKARLESMVADGFVAEMDTLMARPGLHQDSPSMRSVGYRQFWAHLAGESSLEVAKVRALFATRQLAKRQLTWLRSENDLFLVDPLEAGAIDSISTHLARKLH